MKTLGRCKYNETLDSYARLISLFNLIRVRKISFYILLLLSTLLRASDKSMIILQHPVSDPQVTWGRK
jgi:hypothetical protein